jgi:autotransporter-associated beta strand protein
MLRHLLAVMGVMALAIGLVIQVPANATNITLGNVIDSVTPTGTGALATPWIYDYSTSDGNLDWGTDTASKNGLGYVQFVGITDVTSTSGGGTINKLTTGVNVVGYLQIDASGSVDIDGYISTDNDRAGVTSNNAGAITIKGTGSIDVRGVRLDSEGRGRSVSASGTLTTEVRAGGAVALYSQGSITLAGALVTRSEGDAAASGGAVTIGYDSGDLKGGAVTIGGDLLTGGNPSGQYGGGHVTIRSWSDVVIDGDLETSANSTVSADAGNVNITADGSVTINGYLNTSQKATGPSSKSYKPDPGDIAIAAGGDLTVDGPLDLNNYSNQAPDGQLKLAAGGTISIGALDCAGFNLYGTSDTFAAGSGRTFINGALTNYASGEIVAASDQLVYYDPTEANSGVDGTSTYSLTGGGKLTPLSHYVWTGTTSANWEMADDNWSANGGADTTYASGAGTVCQLDSAGTVTVSTNVTAGVVELSGTAVTVADGSNTLTLGGSFTVDSVGFTPDAQLVASGAVTHVVDTNVALASDLTVSTETATGGVSVSGDVSGSFDITKLGAGTLTLSGTNSHVDTNVNAGSLVLGGAASAGTGAINVQGGALDMGAGTLDLGTAALVLTAGSIENGTLQRDDNYTGLAAGTVDAVLDDASDTTAVALVKSAAGTLVLNADNTFTNITISDGTVLIGADVDATGASPLGDGTITLAGGTLGADGTYSIARAIALTGGSSVGGSGNLTISGAISGGSTLTKTGDGTVTLSVSNTHGATAVSAGTLVASVVGSLGSGTVTVNGGTLDVDAADVLVNGVILNTGGTIDIGANDQSMASQVLHMYGGTLSGTGTVSGWAAGSDVDSGTISAVLGGGIGITKDGAGTLTLSSDSSGYAGTIYVSAGTLAVAGSGDLSGGVGISVTAGAVLDLAGTVTDIAASGVGTTVQGTGTFDDLSLGSGGILKPGNSVGTIVGVSSNWGDGGLYEAEVDDAGGTAGGPGGWDLLDLSGILTVDSTTTAFEIDLLSVLLGTSTAGTATDFSHLGNYSWKIVEAADIVDELAAAMTTTKLNTLVTLDVSGFTAENDILGTEFLPGYFTLTVGVDGADDAIFVNYFAATSPVAEPAGLGLIGLALLGLKKKRS